MLPMNAKNSHDLRQRFCSVPWHHFEVAIDQKVYLCCPGFLPVPVGDLRREPPFAIWNSEAARSVRESIIDGSFRYCDKQCCPDLVNRRLPLRDWVGEPPGLLPIPPTSLRIPYSLEKAVLFHKPPEAVCHHWPTRVQLANDRSCNLACPSCRPRFFMTGVDEQEEVHRSFQHLLWDALLRAKRLRMNGAGEFLVSKPCRDLLKELSRTRVPDLRFEFITNGQLFSRTIYDNFDLTGRIELIYVSVDAANSFTYQLLRPGGDFTRLLQNIEFMAELRSTGEEAFCLTLAFVASALNFREMPAFVRMARQFDAKVSFSRMRNWGHFNETVFAHLDVTRDAHPMHADFVRTLCALKSEDAKLDLGDLASCLPVPDGPDTSAVE